MKVLFDHSNPFLLAHGGFQIQIEQTKKALEQVDVEVEFLRWWDATQAGDVIHFFGRPSTRYIEFAHAKGIKVVMAELLGGLGVRPTPARLTQRILIASARQILPAPFTAKLAWDSYRIADAVVALTAYEAHLMQEMFGVPAGKVHVVPNGVETIFFETPAVERGKWLVCTATITERKRVLELARAAVKANTPLWIIGKAYAESDSYVRKFRDLGSAHSDVLKYAGAIEHRSQLAAIYREARGFVLLSTMESLSLSALEAAACECPLLLSDLPWARTTFGNNASYCPVKASTTQTAGALRTFYDSAPSLPLPEKPKTWVEIARELQQIYELVCKTSA